MRTSLDPGTGARFDFELVGWVTRYRAYALDAQGSVKSFEAADDVAALAHARRWVDDCDVEVCQLGRVVAKISHGRPPKRPSQIIWPNGKSSDRRPP